MIQRHQIPTSTYSLDVQARYGIAVEVANPLDEVSIWYLKLRCGMIQGNFTGDATSIFHLSPPNTLLGRS